MTEAPGRSILVVYTGGTIGMVSSGDGYVPQAGAIEAQLVDMPRFHVPGAPRLRLPPSRLGPGARYDIVEHDPPLDSSNMSVREWVRVAREIEQAYDRYDAFVVLHGTDTMAYTASALSFMLEDLGKPVVLTGSQIPLDHLRNDAIDNLLGALLLAAHEPIPEVTLYFRDTLYRGNRVQKVDASGFDAFDSGNWPPLAHWGITIEVDRHRVRPPPERAMRVRPITNEHVAALRLYPGMTAATLDRFLRPPLAGLVLETYGSGNGPNNQPDLLRALRRAHDAGIVVVNVTQCHRGRVSTDYSTGRALSEAGVVPGADMTPEAALTKLAWLLSLGLPTAEVRRLMGVDLRGELTPA
ncbi:MAG TPA: asparaginase [Myxococcota bacterium]|nr:asparaginase [Myxococcota bacterium]